MRGQPSISPVYRMGKEAAPTGTEAWTRVEMLRRRLWRTTGTIVASPAELPAELRKAMTEWAERHYGHRG